MRKPADPRVIRQLQQSRLPQRPLMPRMYDLRKGHKSHLFTNNDVLTCFILAQRSLPALNNPPLFGGDLPFYTRKLLHYTLHLLPLYFFNKHFV